MDEHDNPETDQFNGLQQTEHVEIYVDDEEDVHVCRKCNVVFYDVQKYLEHKVKHDNYKVRYCRSSVDKRMVMPRLIQKPPKLDSKAEHDVNANKENGQEKKKERRVRKKQIEVLKQDLVVTERAGYTCSKCGRKFNREASLKRHIDYDHKEDSDDERDDEDMEHDDSDQEYKPNIDIMNEELAEDAVEERQMEKETPEMDSLDQVIMAAAIVEEAEAQAEAQAQMVNVQVQVSESVDVPVTDGTEAVSGLDSGGGNSLVATPVNKTGTGRLQSPHSAVSRKFMVKRQKLSDDDKAQRKYTCSICDNRFKELTVLKAHLLTHSNQRQFKCRIDSCLYAFKTKGSLKRHMRRHTGERPYGCELCGRNFTESGALTRHLKSRTMCTSKADEDLPRYGKKWAYTPNIPAVQGSLMHDHEQNITVEVNNTELNTDKVRERIQVLQGGEVGDVCSEASLKHDSHMLATVTNTCDKDLFDLETDGSVEVVISADTDTVTADDSIRQFVHSETVIHDAGALVCQVCEEEFETTETLRLHLHTHLADNTCRCLLCHFVTENKDDFESHMFLHHHVQLKGRTSCPLGSNEEPCSDLAVIQRSAQTAVKQLMELPSETDAAGSEGLHLYKCPVCNKHFRDSSYLKLHMRNHTGLRPHKCPDCERCFITKDTLTKHQAIHAEERNFKCGKCGKLFKRLGHVREHIRSHSSARPFPCTVCEKTFKTNNAMKVHLRTHTDILPYECTFCHRRFREKGSVVRHTRGHTGEKPYECQHCGKRFSEHGTLNRHLRAKVSCKKSGNVIEDTRENIGEDIDEEMGVMETDYTVLAEFSSVVADTQQYIVPDGEDKSGQDLVSTTLTGTEKTAEYVVVQDGERFEDVVEIVTDTDGDKSTVQLEGLQISDDYIIVNDADTGCIKIMDSKSGEVVAIVPSESSDNQIQTITMSQEGEVSMVTLLSEAPDDGEEILTVNTLLEPAQELGEEEKQTTEQLHIIEDGLEHSDVTQIIGSVNSGDLVPDEVAQLNDNHDEQTADN